MRVVPYRWQKSIVLAGIGGFFTYLFFAHIVEFFKLVFNGEDNGGGEENILYSVYRQQLLGQSEFLAKQEVHFSMESHLKPSIFIPKPFPRSQLILLINMPDHQITKREYTFESFTASLENHPDVKIFSAIPWDLFPRTFGTRLQDQICLIRIIGNDLPPRHTHDQTLRNVKFTLDHEDKFTNVLKIWIINRVVDDLKRRQIEDLLKSYGQPFLVIPVHLETEYLTVDKVTGRVNGLAHSYDGFQGVDLLHDARFIRMSTKMKSFTVDRLYHEKNLYLMHNNGGRNAALRVGKAFGAEWIMVFDGNCYMTKDAMASILADLALYGSRETSKQRFFDGIDNDINGNFYKYSNNTKLNSYYESPFIRKSKKISGNINNLSGNSTTLNNTLSQVLSSQVWMQVSNGDFKLRNLQYFVVPMARILNNTQLLLYDNGGKTGWTPNANEEPQVIFRQDSSDEFDKDMRYGRRPKVELLWRIGVPKTSFFLKSLPWEQGITALNTGVRELDQEVRRELNCTSRHSALHSKESQSVLWNGLDTPVVPGSSLGSCSLTYPQMNKKYRPTGWTARLFSGNPSQEASDEASKRRNSNRMAGIHEFIDSVDSSILLSHSGLRWDPNIVCSNDEELPKMLSGEYFVERANGILDQQPDVRDLSRRLKVLDYGWPFFAGNVPTLSRLHMIECLLQDTFDLMKAYSVRKEMRYLEKASLLFNLFMNLEEIQTFDSLLSDCTSDANCLSLFTNDNVSSLLHKTEEEGFKVKEDDFVLEEEGRCHWGKKCSSNDLFIPTSSSFVGLLPNKDQWCNLSNNSEVCCTNTTTNNPGTRCGGTCTPSSDSTVRKLQEYIAFLVQVIPFSTLFDTLRLFAASDESFGEESSYKSKDSSRHQKSIYQSFLADWRQRISVLDFWLSYTPHGLGLAPLHTLNTTTPFLLYDMTSPLISSPVYVTQVNRPDRNFCFDYLSLLFAHFLNDRKKFVKSMSSFLSRISASTISTTRINVPTPRSEFSATSSLTTIEGIYRKIEPLYIRSPGHILRGSGIPAYPLKLSKTRFNITWVFHETAESNEDFAFDFNIEQVRSDQVDRENAGGIIGATKITHNTLRVPVGTGLFLYENGFVGAKDPMDSTTRNFQTFILSKHTVRIFSKGDTNPSDVTPIVKFHPWLHTLPLKLGHPLFPQLHFKNTEESTTCDSGSPSNPACSSPLWDSPSPLVPPKLIAALSVESIFKIIQLLEFIHLSIPSTVDNFLSSYLNFPNDSEARPFSENDMVDSAILTNDGKVRPCYYPYQLIQPGIIADQPGLDDIRHWLARRKQAV